MTDLSAPDFSAGSPLALSLVLLVLLSRLSSLSSLFSLSSLSLSFPFPFSKESTPKPAPKKDFAKFRKDHYNMKAAMAEAKR